MIWMSDLTETYMSQHIDYDEVMCRKVVLLLIQS